MSLIKMTIDPKLEMTQVLHNSLFLVSQGKGGNNPLISNLSNQIMKALADLSTHRVLRGL
jgi:hypothetical protein